MNTDKSPALNDLAGAQPPASQRAGILPRWSRSWLLAILAVLLVAAAIVAVRFWRSKGSQGSGPLPIYSLSMSGSGSPAPGQVKDAPPLTWLVGGIVHLVLRPAAAVKYPVTAAAFWMRDDDARPWNAKAEVAGDGTIDLRGTVTNPFPGDIGADLAIVVTRAGDQPPAPAACQPPSCQLIRRRVHFILPIVPALPATDAGR